MHNWQKKIGPALYRFAIATACVAISSTAAAATARDALVNAVFVAISRADALAQLDRIGTTADAALVKSPGNHEARLMRAMVMGYKAKLNRSRTEAMAARAMFEALVADDPRDPEAQAAIGGWHLDAVSGLGGFLARTMLGASKTAGYASLDRAVALGGNRAMFPALAALLRVVLDPHDPQARRLAEAAARANAGAPLDAMLQRGAAIVLARLRNEDFKGAQALARTVLPLGRITG